MNLLYYAVRIVLFKGLCPIEQRRSQILHKWSNLTADRKQSTTGSLTTYWKDATVNLVEQVRSNTFCIQSVAELLANRLASVNADKLVGTDCCLTELWYFHAPTESFHMIRMPGYRPRASSMLDAQLYLKLVSLAGSRERVRLDVSQVVLCLVGAGNM